MSKLSLALASAVLFSVPPVLAQQKPVNLPDGPGRKTVETYCAACHGLSRVVASGYPQAYWHTTIRMMMNFGVPIPQEEVLPLIDYLSQNFPEKLMPVAKIVPGPVQVNFREWQVPTPGSRPHDSLATRDGAIWYTGQLSNKLGRVDTKTGQVREYPLKTPQTAPHGLVEDKDGNIWFTGNNTSIIGKLDPRTQQFQSWVIPSGGYIVRKMDVTPDGNPVMANSTVNVVGMVEVR